MNERLSGPKMLLWAGLLCLLVCAVGATILREWLRGAP